MNTQVDPKIQPAALYTQALAQMEQQEFALAAQQLEQVLALAPHFAEAYVQLGACYGELGQVRKGLHTALEGLMQAPRSGLAIRQLESLWVKRVGMYIQQTFEQTQAPPDFPSISLCMIVKNEEDNLAACLDSVKGLVSEIIIVDTGSSDRTVEVAKSYGARVEHFPWVDDFAAARNESLKYASKEWVLVLDADDRLDALNLLRMKWAVGSGQADAYICGTLNRRADGLEDARSGFIRLFRNLTGLAYENPLHETILRSAIQQDLTICTTNLQVQHWGYRASPEDIQKKLERNLGILTRAVEKNPQDMFSRLVRAQLLAMFHRNEEAIPELELALPNIPDCNLGSTYLGKAFVMLLNEYARTRQVEKLRQVVEQSLRDMLLLRTFYVYGGYCMLTIVGDGARAAQILQVALPLPVRDLDRVYFDEDLQKMLLSEHFLAKLLVRAYLVSGEAALARKTYQELLAKPAAGAEYASKKKLEQAELFVRSTQYMEALKCLNPVHPKDAAALRLLGLAEAMLEAWALAADHFSAAVAVGGPRPGDWSSLAVCELRAQNVGLARGYARLALKENPRDAVAQELLRSAS